MNTRDKIEQQLKSHPIVLYMKGTKAFPQCGFSGRAVHILKECGADFLDVNVLADDEIRQGIKEYGNWPTIPQLYIKGELVGGSDIMVELHKSGELKKLVAEALGQRS